MYGPSPILPLTRAQYEHWQTEIARSDQRREDKITRWDVTGNLKRYEAAKADLAAGDVNDGSDFADVERKSAGLAFAAPFVSLTSDPEMRVPPPQPSPAVLHQELLNTMLGEPMMNAAGVLAKSVQSCLLAIQPAPSKIGYHPTIEMGMALDPTTQQPVQIPQIVHEEFFWTKISEKSLLLPVGLKDTDYDRAAPWMGYRFRMPVSQLRRAYGIPDTVEVPAASGELELFFTDNETKPAESADDPLCTGVYIEYKASLVDPKITHPGLIRCLVLVDGMEQKDAAGNILPIKHEDAPWLINPTTKQFDPQSGFEGFSIHPLATRDFPDSGHVPADSSVTAGMTQEITDFLADTKRQRESNRLVIFYDPSLLPPEMVQRIESGKVPGFVPVKPGSLSQGKDAVATQMVTLGSGREHYLGLEVFQGKRERILGISANTVGAEDQQAKTATEISDVRRNTEARFEKERLRVLAWYLSGVRKISAFLVRYGERLAVRILGEQRGALWKQYRDQGLFNRFTFNISIDGGRFLDVTLERKFWMDLYNQTAKDPNARRTVTLKKLAEVAGLDPNEWVVEQLPEPKPEPPKITFSVAATDLNPTLPHFPFVVSMLRQGGIDIGVTDVQLAQMQAQALGMAGRSPVTGEQEQTETPDPNNPLSMIKELSGPSQVPTAGVGPHPKQKGQPPHGGAADTMERINQHQLAQTGNRSGPSVN